MNDLNNRNEQLIHDLEAMRQRIAQLEEAAKAKFFLAEIVESSDDAIISKTLEGVVNSWNRGAEKIFGYTEKEMIGQSISILIPQDLQDEEPGIHERLKHGERI